MPNDRYTALVRQYCELHKTMPSRTLARLILKENPEMAKTKGGTIDNVRTRVRNCRGANGTVHRLRSSNKYVEQSVVGFIPPPLHNKREMYALNTKGFILYVGDIHVPYHDLDALRLMFDYVLSHYNIVAVVLTGDVWDCVSISKFGKSERPPSMQDEVEYGEDILDAFEDAFPKAKKIWKMGNHEMRIPRYLFTNAPEMWELIHNDVGDIFKLRTRGWDTVGPLQLIQAGKLVVCHGHEVGINSVGVNPARSLYLKTHDTALCFHLHNTSSHTDKTVRGKFPTCWSAGCLCDLSPDYRPYGNRYNHGFAVQELGTGGGFSLENFRILNGKVVR